MSESKLAELQRRIQTLHAEFFSRDYQGKQYAVRSLIEDVRSALQRDDGHIGAWEKAELEYADAAVNVNFLSLALVAAHKAIEVSRLPRAEYDFGFNYSRKN